jgi:cytochrome c-type biogenesis protein
MDVFLAGLSRAVESSPAVAVAAAILWGVLSVLLSPCHLASIPLLVGYINGQSDATPRRAFFISISFASGILLTLTVVGIVTALAGLVLGRVGAWANYLVAALFFVVGLNLIDVLPLSWSAPRRLEMKQKGLLAAFALGLISGIALGPCTFAFMAPVLGVTLKTAAAHPLYGVVLAGSFALGHCATLVFAGTSLQMVMDVQHWNQKSSALAVAKKVCGVLVLLGGIYLMYTSA